MDRCLEKLVIGGRNQHGTRRASMRFYSKVFAHSDGELGVLEGVPVNTPAVGTFRKNIPMAVFEKSRKIKISALFYCLFNCLFDLTAHQ